MVSAVHFLGVMQSSKLSIRLSCVEWPHLASGVAQSDRASLLLAMLAVIADWGRLQQKAEGRSEEGGNGDKVPAVVQRWQSFSQHRRLLCVMADR